ncbi:hypothetical protein [Amycolatopsis sp. NPDC006125]|uniref:hypothetical protein n=1 Tax=Amycolatopsis sp. NPDC006125 TaxID=3156730 RepID=UPI00339ECC2E
MTGQSDVELAVRLLRETPTHENRPAEQLARWAETALAFGDELADRDEPDPPVRVTEAVGGRRDGEVLLAEYHARRGVVTVYRDSLALLRRIAVRHGWDADVPAEALRAAAVAHELVHHRLHHGAGRELNRRLGHTAMRLGRFRVRGHVAGADELVAHRFAHRRSGLGKSPLLLTAALAASLRAGD